MTECEWYGQGGHCGFECPVFLEGGCDIADEIADGASEEDLELYNEIYGDSDENQTD